MHCEAIPSSAEIASTSAQATGPDLEIYLKLTPYNYILIILM